MRFDIKRIQHHEFSVKVPPDYFVKKFNFLVSKSNSIKGSIRSGEFKGFVGPDFFPFAFFVTLFFTLSFSVKEKQGNTHLRVTTALNPTIVWISLIALIVMISGFIYSVFVLKNTSLDTLSFFILAPLLLGFYQWLIFRDSRKKCLDQFQMLLLHVEASWTNRNDSKH